MNRAVVILGQSGGQLAHALQSEWDRVGNLILHGDPALPLGGGLLRPEPEPRPLPPATMTRQQRRYLARKGNR